MPYRSPCKDHIICHLIHVGAYAIRPYLTNRIGLFWIENGFILFCTSLFWIKKEFPPFRISSSWIKNEFLPFRISSSWIKKEFLPFYVRLFRIKNRFIPFRRILFWIKERGKRFRGYLTLALKGDVQDGERPLWEQISKRHSSYLVACPKQLRDIFTA